jgi:hypothetical protein
MITTYLFLQAALFFLTIGGYFQVRQFLSLNTSISNERGLDNFKRLARVNMYVALAYIAISIPMILMSMYIGYTLGIDGLALVLGISIPQIGLGVYLKSSEDKTRSLPCTDQYAAEHRRIGLAWQKNVLPDF